MCRLAYSIVKPSGEVEVRFAFTLLTVFFVSSSLAADEHTFSMFSPEPNLSCGKYLNEITTNRQAENAYRWWVAGFVTGTNLVKGRAVSTDSRAHEAWLKQYCEKNPLGQSGDRTRQRTRKKAGTLRPNYWFESDRLPAQFARGRSAAQCGLPAVASTSNASTFQMAD
jgi:hypothetical protein